MPINAVPASPIIVRTSAKSTLISPGLCVCEEGRKDEGGMGMWSMSMEYERDRERNSDLLSTVIVCLIRLRKHFKYLI